MVVVDFVKDAAACPATGDPPVIASRANRMLDVVFAIDCTGSMGPYIAAVKHNIEKIIGGLVNAQGYELRIGLVAYRDHPPQELTWVVKTFAFTTDLSEMHTNLSSLTAHGGGDGPEAVEAGLKECAGMPWRETATKIVILIADAPPHGLGERGDGFPNGAPTGVDPLLVLDDLSRLGVCVYPVGCQPALSQYCFATDFFVGVAERTNGQAVALGSAAALADVILGASIEECELEKLTHEVHERVRSLQAEGLGDERVQERIFAELQYRGLTTQTLKCNKLASDNSRHVAGAASLQEAKESLRERALPCAKGRPDETHEPMYRGFLSECDVIGYDEDTPVYRSLAASVDEEAPTNCSFEAALQDEVMISNEAISMTQVSRLFSRGKKQGLWG